MSRKRNAIWDDLEAKMTQGKEQNNTIQYNTIQYNTIQFIYPRWNLQYRYIQV